MCLHFPINVITKKKTNVQLYIWAKKARQYCSHNIPTFSSTTYQSPRPIVIFGYEVWAMGKEEAQKMEIWEGKIFGEKVEDGTQKSKTNKKWYELFEEPEILGVLKAQLLW